MDIYHHLDNGRIVELKLGHTGNSDNAIWARNLTNGEKEIYLKLKQSGYADVDIHNYFLNLENNNPSEAAATP